MGDLPPVCSFGRMVKSCIWESWDRVMWAVLVALMLAGTSVEDLEIKASLSGYNLLRPASRCCAFDLHVKPNGEVTMTLLLEGGRQTSTSLLSAEQVASLRQVIQGARFFSLPAHVGPMPVDGDAHVMRIRLGERSWQVTLYAWPKDWGKAPYLTKEELDQTRRAYAVWSAVRALVKEPRATVP